MLTSIFGNAYLVILVLVFLAVLLLLESLYLTWRSHKGPQATKLKKRLDALAATRDRSAETRLLRQRMVSDLPLAERILQSLPRMHALDRAILQSGMNWSVANLLGTCLMAGAATCAVVVLGGHQTLLWGTAAGILVSAMPLMHVLFMRSRRLAKLERQLPEALDLITRALRAGHAFSAALKMVGEEMPEPIAGEFAIVHDEVNFGVSLQQALGHLSERLPLTDLRYFVVAVLIQRESGGNLTEILSNLSNLVRERLKLMGRVRVLSSEGRLSAWILGLMPFFLAGIMNLFNPQFMSPLWTDSIGITIIKSLLVLMLVGAVIMRKIVKIRY